MPPIFESKYEALLYELREQVGRNPDAFLLQVGRAILRNDKATLDECLADEAYSGYIVAWLLGETKTHMEIESAAIAEQAAKVDTLPMQVAVTAEEIAPVEGEPVEISKEELRG